MRLRRTPALMRGLMGFNIFLYLSIQIMYIVLTEIIYDFHNYSELSTQTFAIKFAITYMTVLTVCCVLLYH